MSESDSHTHTGGDLSDGDRTWESGSSRPAEDPPPEQIDRYCIHKLLGKGGFGRVYLATDEQLQRQVAVKVPHARLVSDPSAVTLYLAEAQTVAALDHPSIVPVYDVGSTDAFPLYVVSKLINGTDLAHQLRKERLSPKRSAQLAAAIAAALHYAHKQGVVHRDVKPGNILIEENTPYLVDFGLAARDGVHSRSLRYVGTPAYMSPEQARGEGHRVDGRSDIFSLGVMLYELLAGSKPFRADSYVEMLELVKTFEPRPPRQLDDQIPKELERICLKAMAKRASERFTTAKDMADDLNAFLDDHPETGDDTHKRTASTASLSSQSHALPSRGSSSLPAASWEREPLRIVPKGLRSFDQHDADFFLELLPGPCDRRGFPESVRFWKSRIEDVSPEHTFSVGLIYGPSGCGKSSFVKAGLLPRLDSQVIAVYLEATPHDTEQRMLSALRRACAKLPDNLGLTESVACLRRGEGLDGDEKVVILLDQFEQWLHTHQEQHSHELIDAMRQCDGSRVQVVLMVRDDFWMPVTRYMRQLEIPLVEGHNSAAVDLFQARHARKVLTAFGRANGDIVDSVLLSKTEQQFIEAAVEGLSEEGKVICVRLALFAEMMKGKPWTPATLKSVGGTEGVGVAFLEETFAAASAHPEHRRHCDAARSVLKALLPASGTDIKGSMRSRQQLLLDAGYVSQPIDFNDLLRILDHELRLITPNNREEAAAGDEECYQLSHDYLVPSLRAWLNQKQKETRRGRASLRLEELAAQWNAKPDRRRLPSWWEWIYIGAFANKRRRTTSQQKMMAVATGKHAVTALLWAVMIVGLSFLAWHTRGNLRGAAMLQQLKTAEIQRLPEVVNRLGPYRRWTDGALRQMVSQATSDSREQLHASLALLPVDASQAESLKPRLLDADIATLTVIVAELKRHKCDVNTFLWEQLDDEALEPHARFHAALALAKLDPPRDGKADIRWVKHADFLGTTLVERAVSHPYEFNQLVELMRGARKLLLKPLHALLLDADPIQKVTTTTMLLDYGTDQPAILADMAMDASPEQFFVLLPLMSPYKTAVTSRFRDRLTVSPGARTATNRDAQDRLARQQANAVIALLHFGHTEEAWRLLRHSSNPSARSYLIDRFARFDADPLVLMRRLAEEKDLSVRRALLLSLGQYEFKELPSTPRDVFVSRLRQLYREDSDAGIHGAAEWLLRTWGQTEALQAEPVNNIRPRQWRDGPNGHTMISIDAGQDTDVGHQFAISSKEVTVAQFREFHPRRWMPDGNGRAEAAAGVIPWHDAIAYCQWLNQQEDIPQDQWCYPAIETGATDVPVVKADLTRSGYRLPTNAEWLYAARAGATTDRYFGDADGLIDRYTWFQANAAGHTQLVGRLKPNDFGLFDMHGNVSEWTTSILQRQLMGIAGSSFGSEGSFIHLNEIDGALPETRFNSYGFRVARTVLPSADSK